MDKQSIMEINKEFVKLVAENPELPIKVFVNGGMRRWRLLVCRRNLRL